MEKRIWTVTSFSIPLDELPMLNEFEKLAKRDGKSRSQLIVDALKEYLHRHLPPNLQSDLDYVLETKMPIKPSWQCCVEDCKAKARTRLFLKTFDGKEKPFNVCERHKHWKHSEFRLLVGTKEL